MTVQCCKCKRLRVAGEWISPGGAVEGLVSHAYCPSCLDECRVEIFATQASHAARSGAAFVLRVLTAAAPA
jgi:hypothetical protein